MQNLSIILQNLFLHPKHQLGKAFEDWKEGYDKFLQKFASFGSFGIIRLSYFKGFLIRSRELFNVHFVLKRAYSSSSPSCFSLFFSCLGNFLFLSLIVFLFFPLGFFGLQIFLSWTLPWSSLFPCYCSLLPVLWQKLSIYLIHYIDLDPLPGADQVNGDVMIAG